MGSTTAIITILLINSGALITAHMLSDEFIERINQKQTTWRAGRNFPPDTPISYLKKISGGVVSTEYSSNLPRVEHPRELVDNLPEHFDARNKWTNCPTLNDIRDQGGCGSCWAFGAVSAMTDRQCIYSNGTKQFNYSADDLLSCCWKADGCDGGNPEYAWLYWMLFGIVSGGSYNSSQGCRPYEIPPCKHGVNMTSCKNHKTPKCVKKCQPKYNGNYKADLHYGEEVTVIINEVDYIKAELFENGPVETTFDVYSDFLSYKSGVYKYAEGKKIGRHAVKILGWGVENGVKYWLVANSWNTDWGDKGFFKILRGCNHCGIEELILAGTPKFKN